MEKHHTSRQRLKSNIKAQLQHLIDTRFAPDERKLIFWFDPNRTFQKAFRRIKLEGFTKVGLTESNEISTKIWLETEGIDKNAVIYCPFEERPPKEDPLRDLVHQGQRFAADQVSLLMLRLDLTNPECHSVLSALPDDFFLKEKAWFKKLSPMLFRTMTGEELRKAMLFSLAGVSHLDAFHDVLIALFEEGPEFGALWRIWQAYNKLDGIFWALMKNEFGCSKCTHIWEIAANLFISAWAGKSDISNVYGTWVTSQPNQALAFIKYWRQQSLVSFNAFAEIVQKQLHIEEHLDTIRVENWAFSDVLPLFENLRLRKVIQCQLGDHMKEARVWLENCSFSDSTSIRLLRSSQSFFEAKAHFLDDSRKSPFYQAYTDSHYRVDQCYRWFYVIWDEHKDWNEAEHQLREKVEHGYVCQFLAKCSARWWQCLEKFGSWENWPKGLPREHQHYFAQHVLNAYRPVRTYVVISGALRYEAGMELADALDKMPGETSCEPMVAVIPTCPELGNAALLPKKNPRESISYLGKGRVAVDGMSSWGVANKAKIVQAKWPDGTAIRYKDFVGMSRARAKTWQRDYRTIYVFHDVISRTSTAKTKHKVFRAVGKAIQELKGFVRRAVALSATNVLITTDHGFLCQRSKQEYLENVKVPKSDPKSVLEGNERFTLGSELMPLNNRAFINMSYLLGQKTKLKALLAADPTLFSQPENHSGLVHGGASLQEVVLPLIRYKHKKGASRRAS